MALPCAFVAELDYGARPFARVTFIRNTTGQRDDPSTVRFTWQDPSGDQQVFTSPDATITNPSLGVWECLLPQAVTEAGTWLVRAEGLAGLVATAEGSFTVDESIFAGAP